MLMNLKTLFLSKPFISLCQDSVNGGEVYLGVVISGFVGVSLININTSAVFCWSLVGGYYVRFNLRRGALAASSLVGSLVSSLVSSSVSSLVGSLVSSLVGSLSISLLSFFRLSYRYSFTAVVLKLVGPLSNYTLYISLPILSNLNRPVYLPLCLVLPFCYISMSKLRGRSWIVVMDGPFYWFSALLTCFFALIFIISSIAFFIATAYYIIDSAGRLNLLI